MPACTTSELREDVTDPTKPRVLPMPLLEISTLVPRTKHPMRTETIEVGDKLVWVRPAPPVRLLAHTRTASHTLAHRMALSTPPASPSALAAHPPLAPQHHQEFFGLQASSVWL